jgi:hypothetical protein
MDALRDFVDEGPVGKRRLPKLVVEQAAIDDEEDLEAEAVPSSEAPRVVVVAEVEVEAELDVAGEL